MQGKHESGSTTPHSRLSSASSDDIKTPSRQYAHVTPDASTVPLTVVQDGPGVDKSMDHVVDVSMGLSTEKNVQIKTSSNANTHSTDEKNTLVKAASAEGVRLLDPPDGGYGIVIVACQTTINMMTWGVNASYAVYLAYYTAPGSTHFSGTTTLQYTFIGGVSVGMALIVSPLATAMVELSGHLKLPMYIGLVMESLGFLCASFATKFWHLMLAQGILFGAGMGLLFAPSVTVPMAWFFKRRALASGICAAGSGLGGVIFNLGTQKMIEATSLAWTFRITALITLVCNTIAVLLLRELNPRPSASMTFSQRKARVVGQLWDMRVFRIKGYGYILAWGIASLLGYVTIQFTISKYVVSYLGLSQTRGSQAAALLSAGMAIGRPLVGFIADRYGRINMAIFFTMLCSLSVFFIWMFTESFGLMVFFALFNGCICGTFWSSVIPVTVEVVGIENLSIASTGVWLVMAIPTVFATTLSIEIVGDSGDYRRLIGFAGAMFFLAALLLVPAKIYKQERILGSEGKYKIWAKT